MAATDGSGGVVAVGGVWCAATSNFLYPFTFAEKKKSTIVAATCSDTQPPATTTPIAALFALNVHNSILRAKGDLATSSPWGSIDICCSRDTDVGEKKSVFSGGECKLLGYTSTLGQLGCELSLVAQQQQPPRTKEEETDGEVSVAPLRVQIPPDTPVAVATSMVGKSAAADIFIGKFYQLHHSMMAVNRTLTGLLYSLKRANTISSASILMDMRRVTHVSHDALNIPTLLGVSSRDHDARVDNGEDNKSTVVRLWRREDIENLPPTLDVQFGLIGEWAATTAVVRVRKLAIVRGDGREIDVTAGRAKSGQLFAMLDNQSAHIAVHSTFHKSMVETMQRNDGRSIAWLNSNIWTHPCLTTSDAHVRDTLEQYERPPCIVVGLETQTGGVVDLTIRRDAWLRHSPAVTITQHCPALSSIPMTRVVQDTTIMIDTLPNTLSPSCMLLGAVVLFGRCTCLDFDANCMHVYDGSST